MAAGHAAEDQRALPHSDAERARGTWFASHVPAVCV